MGRFQGTKRRNKGVFDNAEYNKFSQSSSTSSTSTSQSQQSFSQQKLENIKRMNTNRPQVSSNSKRDEQVWAALSNLELDMQLLDNLAGQKPQLSALELLMLSGSVAAASSSPWIMGGSLTEVLPPTAAACKYDMYYRIDIVTFFCETCKSSIIVSFLSLSILCMSVHTSNLRGTYLFGIGFEMLLLACLIVLCSFRCDWNRRGIRRASGSCRW